MVTRRSGKASRSKDDRVLTPGGWRASSQVHHVPPDCEVSGAGGRLRIVKRATGEIVEDLGPIDNARRSARTSAPKRASSRRKP